MISKGQGSYFLPLKRVVHISVYQTLHQSFSLCASVHKHLKKLSCWFLVVLYRFPSLVPSEHQVLGSHYIIFTSLSLKEKYNLVSFRWWTQCCRSPPHDCPRKQKRKPLSVIPSFIFMSFRNITCSICPLYTYAEEKIER